MWKVNEDGISITDPNGKVYVAGDEITRPDGTIIMVKTDWQGITNEDLRKYVPDARSWNGVIVASLNIKGEDGQNATQAQVDRAIENANTMSLNDDDFIIGETEVRINWSRAGESDGFWEEVAGSGSEPDLRPVNQNSILDLYRVRVYGGIRFFELLVVEKTIELDTSPTEDLHATNKKYVDDQNYWQLNDNMISPKNNNAILEVRKFQWISDNGSNIIQINADNGDFITNYLEIADYLAIDTNIGNSNWEQEGYQRYVPNVKDVKEYVSQETTFKESTNDGPLKVTDVSIQGVIDGTESWVIPTGQRIDTDLNQITEQILWEIEEDNLTVNLKTPAHIDMKGHTLINLDPPVNILEPATKGYVDQEINKINAFERATSGEGVRYFIAGQPDIDIYSMGGHNLEDLGTPVKDDDAVTKKYVDEQITAVHDYVDSSIQLMTDFFQAQITQIHDAVYSQYMAFDINSNQRWTFADYDTGYWFMLYITVRLTGNRLVTGFVEIPAGTISGTEVANVISDTVSGSSNNLRFLNGQVWCDNWNGDPIFITTIRIMRRKEL